jgi:type II secretory pathway component PulF
VPAFRYEAVDAVGNTRKGVVNADSARAARSDLRSQGMAPITVDAIAAQVDELGQTRKRAFGDRLSTTELALFTRQLASLLEASLPLEQAFSALLEQAERPYVRDLPQIVSVFANTKQKLPMLTVIMLAISDFVRSYGWIVLVIVTILFIAWRRALRNPDIKYRWHSWLLTAPLYGKFERSLNTARFASTLAITTGSGVPILRALQTSRDTLGNVAMRAQVEEATASVREGVGLARALSAHKHFPPMLIHMIRAGEVTGELPAMLERASNAQEQDLERRAMTIAGLLEPALILVMGVVVLLIVLAVLMPIIEINQLVR